MRAVGSHGVGPCRASGIVGNDLAARRLLRSGGWITLSSSIKFRTHGSYPVRFAILFCVHSATNYPVEAR